MKICYLCGEFIKEDNEDVSSICLPCDVHYCERCSLNAQVCYTCDTPLQKKSIYQKQDDRSEDVFSRVSLVEKREKERKSFKTTVRYILSVSKDAIQKNVTYKGITRDISQSGICIYSLNPLRAGQRLNILIRAVHNIPKTAIVQWVKRVDDKIYKAGLKFA